MIKLIRTGLKIYSTYRAVSTIKAKLTKKKPPTIFDDIKFAIKKLK